MIVMSTSISDRMPGPSKLAMPVRSRSPAPIDAHLRGHLDSSGSPFEILGRSPTNPRRVDVAVARFPRTAVRDAGLS
jgi:hypothetical protein